jgi:putative (di)nucleoside polyphosphate hydrolase
MASDLPAYRPCVGIMVLNRAGKVWIGRRFDAPAEPEGPGAWWQMPQGGIDASEDPAAAALREANEETGIRSVTLIAECGLVRLRPAGRSAAEGLGGRTRAEAKWFAARPTGSDEVTLVRPGHKPEFDAWRWADLAELIGLVVPFKRGSARVVAEFATLAAPDA